MLEEVELVAVVDAMMIHFPFLLLEDPLLQLSVVPILASIVSIQKLILYIFDNTFLISVYIDVPTDCALLSFHLADGVSTTRYALSKSK